MRYCGHRLAADIVFALFTLVWIVTRHFLYWIPVYSLTVHAPNEITVDFDPSIGSYYSRKWTHVFYLTLFIILQVSTVSFDGVLCGHTDSSLTVWPAGPPPVLAEASHRCCAQGIDSWAH